MIVFHIVAACGYRMAIAQHELASLIRGRIAVGLQVRSIIGYATLGSRKLDTVADYFAVRLSRRTARRARRKIAIESLLTPNGC